jgi:ribosomal protein S18 acetylase RimI-like enzyme
MRKEKAVQQKITNQRAWLDWMEVGAFDASEIEEVLDVLARGMRDNPLHVAAFGEDPERRRRSFRGLMAAAFSIRDISHTLVARREDGVIVGVCGMMPPGNCLPDFRQRLRLLPTLLSIGPRAVGRMMRWLGVWEKHDPEERHWHLGPLAVDAHLQGMGVGSRMMQVFCAQMDAAREDTYLETDKRENVRFYERFGFEVVGEQEVLGVTNYFMLRRAERRHG